MGISLERAGNKLRSFYRRNEDKIIPAQAFVVTALLVGILAKVYTDPEFNRMMFEYDGGRPLMRDLEQTDGVNLQVVPGSNAFVISLRESARFARRGEIPEQARRRIALLTGCEPGVPYQINRYAESSFVLPGQDTSPVYIVTVSCPNPNS